MAKTDQFSGFSKVNRSEIFSLTPPCWVLTMREKSRANPCKKGSLAMPIRSNVKSSLKFAEPKNSESVSRNGGVMMSKPVNLEPDELPAHLRRENEKITDENRMRRLPNHRPVPERAKRETVRPSNRSFLSLDLVIEEIPKYLVKSDFLWRRFDE